MLFQRYVENYVARQSSRKSKLPFYDEEKKCKQGLMSTLLSVRPGYFDRSLTTYLDNLSTMKNYDFSGKTVLEIGCGYGTALFELLNKIGPAGRLVVLDIEGELLEIAKKRLIKKLKDKGLRDTYEVVKISDPIDADFDRKFQEKYPGKSAVIFVHADAEEVGKWSRPQYFDVIIAYEVFAYIDDKISAMLQMLNLLKLGGKIFASIDHGNSVELIDGLSNDRVGDLTKEIYTNKGGVIRGDAWLSSARKSRATIIKDFCQKDTKPLYIKDFLKNYFKDLEVQVEDNIRFTITLKKDRYPKIKKEIPNYAFSDAWTGSTVRKVYVDSFYMV